MISKELFIASIEAIELQFQKDEQAEQALSTVFTDYSGYYDYSNILFALENILKDNFGDNTNESWIDYFIYELDFGKKWKENSITYELDGKEVSINMRNASELYDYLILNK